MVPPCPIWAPPLCWFSSGEEDEVLAVDATICGRDMSRKKLNIEPLDLIQWPQLDERYRFELINLSRRSVIQRLARVTTVTLDL